jgi:hypothetical protein
MLIAQEFNFFLVLVCISSGQYVLTLNNSMDRRQCVVS